MTLEQLSLSPAEVDLLKNCDPITLDLDGVLVYTQVRSLEVANTLLGTTYTLEHLTHSYEMNEWFKQRYQESEEDLMKRNIAHWNSPEVMGKSQPLPGSGEVLRYLSSLGIKPHFVTSRPNSARQTTNEWFKHFFPEISPLQIHLQSTEKYNHNYKVDTISSYKVKVHFEDFGEDALEIVKQTNCLVVLVGHPWNRTYPDHPRIIRPQGIEKEADIRHSLLKLVTYLQNRGV